MIAARAAGCGFTQPERVHLPVRVGPLRGRAHGRPDHRAQLHDSNLGRSGYAFSSRIHIPTVGVEGGGLVLC